MFNKVLCCFVVVLIGVSEVNATLFSGCFNEISENLYETGVETGCDVTMTHLVFAAAACAELVSASCDVVINHQEKTVKILPCEGNCLEEKRFSLINLWLAKKYEEFDVYKWVTDTK
jgi:hypothetical protein